MVAGPEATSGSMPSQDVAAYSGACLDVDNVEGTSSGVGRIRNFRLLVRDS